MKNQEDIPKLKRSDINLLLIMGFCFILPLLGTTIFHMTAQIVEYIQYGYFYYDCQLYYYPTFDKTSFADCKSTDIIGLLIAYPITTSMFFIMANIVRKRIIQVLLKK